MPAEDDADGTLVSWRYTVLRRPPSGDAIETCFDRVARDDLLFRRKGGVERQPCVPALPVQRCILLPYAVTERGHRGEIRLRLGEFGLERRRDLGEVGAGRFMCGFGLRNHRVPLLLLGCVQIKLRFELGQHGERAAAVQRLRLRQRQHRDDAEDGGEQCDGETFHQLFLRLRAVGLAHYPAVCGDARPGV
jgi:hypothetical protein